MKEIECSLCGYRFEPGACSSQCPMSQGCHLACCPRCGYQMVTQSALASAVSKLWQKVRGGKKHDLGKAG